MPERIVLDPVEEAPTRTAFDITAWIADEGVDWGDGEIQAYMADQSRGATPVDFRLPNRQVQIPLILRERGGTAFSTARSLFQAKASLAQREGCWLKRITSAGGTVFAEVVNATWKIGGGWSQSVKDYDLDAMLTLECKPDFYEAEVTLADHTETSLSELVFTEATVRGDYPARVRIVVDDDQGQSQLGLIWSVRNRHYSSAVTAATRFEAEALNPLDTAARAALTGASGGTVVTHGTLSTNWTPVLDMRVGGTAYPTHTGTNRLWVRYRTTSGTAVQLRAVWDVGDMVFPVENTPIRSNAGTQLFMADLGEMRLDPSPVGTHRWNAIIQAKGDASAENVSIDKVWVLNADEGYGVERAPITADSGLVNYSARDEFNQTAGALTGKTATSGGVWVGAGDADDFAVETSGKTAQRTATLDTAVTGRWATLDVNLTTTVVQADFKSSTVSQGNHLGVVARYAGTTNHVRAYLRAAAGPDITIVKRVAGTDTDLAFTELAAGAPGLGKFVGTLAADTWYTMRLLIDAAGRFVLWFGPRGSALPVLVTGSDSVLATGGALAAGDVGLYDEHGTSNAVTRNYDNFAGWAPTLDAVVNPSQSVELRWDGVFREDSTGTAYGPVSWVTGDLPRLPPTVEGRPTEVFIKASRGDFETLPDAGIDDISARAYYKACWLTVPGA